MANNDPGKLAKNPMANSEPWTFGNVLFARMANIDPEIVLIASVLMANSESGTLIKSPDGKQWL